MGSTIQSWWDWAIGNGTQTQCQLETMLLDRNYKSSMIDASIRRARAIPRSRALQKVANSNQTKRPVYAVTWDPRLPNQSKILGKHWRSMTISSPYMKEVFPEPPLVAYKRQKNISDFLIRAKVPIKSQNCQKRRLNGMKKCQKNYVIFSYIKEGNNVKGAQFTCVAGFVARHLVLL